MPARCKKPGCGAVLAARYEVGLAVGGSSASRATMEAIQRIVREIVFMCRVRNVPVSDTLAAFMARAVVLENATQFPLDKELNENDVQDLVKMATERLLMKDSPSLEMVKMQVGFDTASAKEVETLGRTKEKLDASEVRVRVRVRVSLTPTLTLTLTLSKAPEADSRDRFLDLFHSIGSILNRPAKRAKVGLTGLGLA